MTQTLATTRVFTLYLSFVCFGKKDMNALYLFLSSFVTLFTLRWREGKTERTDLDARMRKKRENFNLYLCRTNTLNNKIVQFDVI